ncbi:MAG: hypothetical protein ABW003_23855 [Microvirga sp.]
MDTGAVIEGNGHLDFRKMTANLLAAYVSHNRVLASEVPALITVMAAAFIGLQTSDPPAMPGSKRVTTAQITCPTSASWPRMSGSDTVGNVRGWPGRVGSGRSPRIDFFDRVSAIEHGYLGYDRRDAGVEQDGVNTNRERRSVRGSGW